MQIKTFTLLKDRKPADDALFMFTDKETAEAVLKYITDNDHKDMNWQIHQEGELGGHEFYLMNQLGQALGVIKF